MFKAHINVSFGCRHQSCCNIYNYTCTILLTLLFSRASGTTVVCAKGPGGSELVVHDKTGYLVDVNDPQDCIRGIQMLAEDSEMRKRLANEATSVIMSEQAFDWQHVTNMLVGHYTSLTSPVFDKTNS